MKMSGTDHGTTIAYMTDFGKIFIFNKKKFSRLCAARCDSESPVDSPVSWTSNLDIFAFF